MKLVGSPTGVESLLGRRDTTSERLTALLGQNSNLSAPTLQAFSTGNRCGHNKNDPRFYSAHANIDKFPKIIQRAQSILELSYFDPKKFWWSLNFLDKQQKRSERRESCAIVAQYLNIRNNLKDFTVKSPARDIAHYTKLSLSRVKQALRDLTRAGYIKTTTFIKHCFKGAWYGITAIRQLTDKFYLELGISDHALHSARCWKSGNKMQDTRKDKINKSKGMTMTNVMDFWGPEKKQNVSSSSVNSKAFYQSENPSKDEKTTNDLANSYMLNADIANDLMVKAKEEAKETSSPWFKIYHRLEKEYRAQNSPPST